MISPLSRWFRSRLLPITKKAATRKDAARLFLEPLEDRTVPSTIQGALFEDVNGDGNIATDPNLALAGVTMYLDQNRNGLRDSGETTATTNSSGAYSFTGLAAGTYHVAQETPAGWFQTSPPPSYGTGVFGEVTQDFAAQGVRLAGMTWANGSLYVADYKTTPDAADDVIRQIDPVTGQQISEFAGPGTEAVVGLTFDGTYFWATSYASRHIYQFDSSGTVYKTFSLPDGSTPWGIVWDGSTLWVANVNPSTTIYNIDPTDGHVIRSFASPAGDVRGLGYDGTHLWVSAPSYPNLSESRIHMLDMTTGAVLRSMSPPQGRPNGLAFDGQQLWVYEWEAHRLYRVNISDSGHHTVSVDGTNDVTGLTFGNFHGTVSGRVFSDNDQDGTQDPGDGGLAGWRVFIDGNGNGTYDSWERSAMTNSLGDYVIGGLRAGTHTVISDLAEQRLSRWSATSPAGNTHSATLTTSGQSAQGKNFGYFLDRSGPIATNEWGTFAGGEMNLFTGLSWYFSGVVANFDTATALVADSTHNGFTDWRLPTKAEALAAAANGVGDRLDLPQASPGGGFLYWTSTGGGRGGQLIWTVDLDNPSGSAFEANKGSGVYVAGVRNTGLVIDDGSTGYSSSGFSTKSNSGAYQGDQQTAASNGTRLATWNFTGLEAGATYKVDVTWKTVNGAASLAPFTVLDGTTVVGSRSLDQRVAPNDFTTGEATAWEGLGVYTLTGNSLSVRLNNSATGTVIADAVRIFKVLPSYTVSALLAADLPTGTSATETIANADVHPLVDQALQRWQAAGVDTSSLGPINLQIANLGGTTLGLASGNTIWLDDNAAGWGWFVDPTPWDDSEFRLAGDQGEQNRMDLLSVLTHEIGHLLGFEHEEDGVMHETLSAGERLVSNQLADVTADWDLSAMWEWESKKRK